MKTKLIMLLTVAALLVTISGTAQAITFNRPYANEPIMWDLTNWDSGTIWLNNTGAPYTGALPGGAGDFTEITAPGAWNLTQDILWDDATANPGDAKEDTWGTFRINSLFPAWAGDYGSNTINPDPLDTAVLWQESLTDGKELVGVFYGADDIAIIDPDDPSEAQTIESVGIKIKVWEQDYGTWAAVNGPIQGSAGRTGLDTYNGIGGAGSSLLFAAQGVPGFIDLIDADGDGVPDFPEATLRSVFNASVTPGSPSGDAVLFSEVTDGDWGPGSFPTLDYNWFVSSLDDVFADIRTELITELNNPFNTVGENLFGVGDWTVTSNDENEAWLIVPEPVTMLGVFLGLGSLSGYIRKRKMA